MIVMCMCVWFVVFVVIVMVIVVVGCMVGLDYWCLFVDILVVWWFDLVD